ncbi:adenosine deaminase [Aliiglaciecola litoralis]|uniref:Adenine deaminase n=1 Tax=Aliiglaciecola litoralis TaxID=582857 RepID=A0ABN1LC12_9ALTE
MSIESLIQSLPKAELHLHIEGSLEPELMMHLAQKHQVDLPYKSIEQVRKAYQFEDLQSFLDLYYLGASVLIDEQDFYQLMWQYLCQCRAQNIVHTEIMFDPQTHTHRGIGFDIFMPGFLRAMEVAYQQWGQSSQLILSFLRHLPEQDAIDTFVQAQPYLHQVTAVGLDSSELNHPPTKFKSVYAQAAKKGLKLVAHAGEEGPPEYIWEALNELQVDRIDHGVRSIEDPELVQTLINKQMPLTVCPLSNTKLCVFDDMTQHNILSMLERDILVTVNSDDPSYFGGYLNENFLALHQAFDLTPAQLIQLVKNSFKASFLDESKKRYWLAKIDEFANNTD